MTGTGSSSTSFLDKLFISSSVSLYRLNNSQKIQPVIKVAIARPTYIHINFGFSAVGDKAIPMADPRALVRRKILMTCYSVLELFVKYVRVCELTKDFIEGGALVKAYSSPVMEAKISLRPMKR